MSMPHDGNGNWAQELHYDYSQHPMGSSNDFEMGGEYMPDPNAHLEPPPAALVAESPASTLGPSDSVSNTHSPPRTSLDDEEEEIPRQNTDEENMVALGDILGHAAEHQKKQRFAKLGRLGGRGRGGLLGGAARRQPSATSVPTAAAQVSPPRQASSSQPQPSISMPPPPPPPQIRAPQISPPIVSVSAPPPPTSTMDSYMMPPDPFGETAPIPPNPFNGAFPTHEPKQPRNPPAVTVDVLLAEGRSTEVFLKSLILEGMFDKPNQPRFSHHNGGLYVVVQPEYGQEVYPQLWPRAPVFVVNSSLFGPHDLNQLHNRFLADGASTCFLDPFFNKDRFPTEGEDDCLHRYDLLLAKLIEERKYARVEFPLTSSSSGTGMAVYPRSFPESKTGWRLAGALYAQNPIPQWGPSRAEQKRPMSNPNPSSEGQGGEQSRPIARLPLNRIARGGSHMAGTRPPPGHQPPPSGPVPPPVQAPQQQPVTMQPQPTNGGAYPSNDWNPQYLPQQQQNQAPFPSSQPIPQPQPQPQQSYPQHQPHPMAPQHSPTHTSPPHHTANSPNQNQMGYQTNPSRPAPAPQGYQPNLSYLDPTVYHPSMGAVGAGPSVASSMSAPQPVPRPGYGAAANLPAGMDYMGQLQQAQAGQPYDGQHQQSPQAPTYNHPSQTLDYTAVQPQQQQPNDFLTFTDQHPQHPEQQQMDFSNIDFAAYQQLISQGAIIDPSTGMVYWPQDQGQSQMQGQGQASGSGAGQGAGVGPQGWNNHA